MKHLLLTLLAVSCATEKTSKPVFDPAKVIAVQNELILSLKEKEADNRGFLTGLLNEGDSFLWQAKWCAVTGCDMSEYKSESRGKYCRDIDCDVHKSDDNKDGRPDSNTSWSGDMAVCGLIPWALLEKKTDEMAKHVQYGEANRWFMGDLAEGLTTAQVVDANTRVLYSISLRRQMRNVRDYLEGKGTVSLPFIDTGKDDYKAHLQACQIWAQAYMTGEASEAMRTIVRKHHERVPKSPFYAYLHGLLNGQWQPVKELCESEEAYLGDYIRCDGSKHCAYAEKVFACELTIRSVNKKG